MKKRLDSKQLTKLNHILALRMHLVLPRFGIQFEMTDELIQCCCPLHGGDNPSAFTINVDPESEYLGVFACWSRECHLDHINTCIGLVRALLEIKHDRSVNFHEAVEHCIELVGIDPEKLEEEAANLDFSNNPSKDEIYRRKREANKRKGVTRDRVRSSLSMPAKYYLNRGYSESVLNEFDVGVCDNPNKPMHDRVVVPVYDDDFENYVGCVGRVMHENYNGRKWVNEKKFNTGVWLYGYWLSKPFVKSSKSVILVEGQGDVWRLWEAGIKNVVGIFGCTLTDAQARILETSGAMNIVLLTDSDEAGQKGRKSIRKKCERVFNIVEVELPTKDVGELTVKEIEENIKPKIKDYIND